MKATQILAKHLREVYFGGNWTFSNLKEQLADVNLKKASASVYELNSIVKLVYHIDYYVRAALKVVKGGPLDAKDKYSFDHPNFESEADWKNFIVSVLNNAEELASLIEQMPEEKLSETFVEEKYGTYYRNFLGIIEHTHYHLGQIAIVKKIINQQKE